MRVGSLNMASNRQRRHVEGLCSPCHTLADAPVAEDVSLPCSSSIIPLVSQYPLGSCQAVQWLRDGVGELCLPHHGARVAMPMCRLPRRRWAPVDLIGQCLGVAWGEYGA
jgi:hypothetical protein